MWRMGHQIRVKAKKKRRARATAPKGRRWNAFLEAWCCSVWTSCSLNNSWASPGRPQNPIWWLSAWMCFPSVCYCCLFELLNHKFRSCIIELASRASSKDGYQVWNRQLVNVGGGKTHFNCYYVCVCPGIWCFICAQIMFTIGKEIISAYWLNSLLIIGQRTL